MMSPASVAQYIRPGSLAFDLLVIDEASQMRPEFALSAILRGQQFVVVGDANQLPPADHFQLATSIDGGGGGDDGLGVDGATDPFSILPTSVSAASGACCAYRFQHERLINFSNRKFYESDLVFPSPRGDDDALLGVHYRYVPAIHADTVYEASVNQREAQEVIDEAYRLMIAYPEHSIGIAAMNAKQTELIQNEFDRLILERPEVQLCAAVCRHGGKILHQEPGERAG
jgi:superfamily I DNA and/or RNA helicase